MGIKLNGNEVEFHKLKYTLIDRGTTSSCERANGTATYELEYYVLSPASLKIKIYKKDIRLFDGTIIEHPSTFTTPSTIDITQLTIENIQLIHGTSPSDIKTFIGTTSWSEDTDYIYCTLTPDYSAMGIAGAKIYLVLYDIKYGSPRHYLCANSSNILSNFLATTNLDMVRLDSNVTNSYNVTGWRSYDNNTPYEIRTPLQSGDKVSLQSLNKLFDVIPLCSTGWVSSRIETSVKRSYYKIQVEVE